MSKFYVVCVCRNLHFGGSVCNLQHLSALDAVSQRCAGLSVQSKTVREKSDRENAHAAEVSTKIRWLHFGNSTGARLLCYRTQKFAPRQQQQITLD